MLGLYVPVKKQKNKNAVTLSKLGAKKSHLARATVGVASGKAAAMTYALAPSRLYPGFGLATGGGHANVPWGGIAWPDRLAS